MTKREYDKIVRTFDRMAERYGRSGGLEEVNRERLAPEARAFQGRVLDVGCGAGAFIEKYFDPARHTLCTVDFSEAMLEQSRQRLDGRGSGRLFFLRGIAQRLPFGDGAFDACVCVNTLHNMPQWDDAQRALEEMARVLKPGGRLLVEFRNALNPARRRIALLYDYDTLPQKAFQPDAVIHALNNSGLEVEKKIPLFGDKPGKTSVADSAMRGLIGARAPRMALLATKAPPFKDVLGGAGNET